MLSVIVVLISIKLINRKWEQLILSLLSDKLITTDYAISATTIQDCRCSIIDRKISFIYSIAPLFDGPVNSVIESSNIILDISKLPILPPNKNNVNIDIYKNDDKYSMQIYHRVSEV